jgi:hypothetical protein
MWWCCGKNSKEALGCKFAKHECKDDEEDDKEKDEEEEKTKERRIKCQCCKDLGHKTD